VLLFLSLSFSLLSQRREPFEREVRKLLNIYLLSPLKFRVYVN
jgi:hypothetical protein